MKYKKTLKRGLAGVVVGGMLLSGGMAFADDTNDTKAQNPIGKHFAGKMMQGERQDLFIELVENKIITQEQADAIRTYIRENAIAKQHQDMQDSLKAVVEKGAITQNQADKVINRFDEIRKNHEALFEKTKDMTPEERRKYMIDNKEKVDPLNQLVTDGVITQEQADAIREALPHRKGFKGGR